jgi:hypothetical protein
MEFVARPGRTLVRSSSDAGYMADSCGDFKAGPVAPGVVDNAWNIRECLAA